MKKSKRLFLIVLTVAAGATPWVGEYLEDKQDDILQDFAKKTATMQILKEGDIVANYQIEMSEHMKAYLDQQAFVADHKKNIGFWFSGFGMMCAAALGYYALDEEKKG